MYNNKTVCCLSSRKDCLREISWKKRKSITLTSLHQTQKGITLITLNPDFLIATSLIRLTSFIDITDKNSEREKRSFDSKAILVFIYTVTYTCTALMRHINGEKKIDEVRITRDKVDLFPLFWRVYVPLCLFSILSVIFGKVVRIGFLFARRTHSRTLHVWHLHASSIGCRRNNTTLPLVNVARIPIAQEPNYNQRDLNNTLHFIAFCDPSSTMFHQTFV